MYKDDERLPMSEDIEKAYHNGEYGKFRRVKGKNTFIRAKDKKVTKGPKQLKGKRLVMKLDSSTDSVVNSTQGELGRLRPNL
jgi:hypothetical protein